MRDAQHQEHHFTGGALVRDVVIGMSDGLTVPFALAAGLSGAVAASRLVVTAGLAEVVAGSIAMGLGGFLAARSDAEHYRAELARERHEVATKEADEIREIEELFEAYGIARAESASVAAALRRDPEQWVRFMMRFELGLEEPDPKQALRSAVTIATAYVVGGLIPLAPYFVVETTAEALLPSVALTAAALLAFGAVKGHFTTGRRIGGALQTLMIGGLAATAAFALARLLG
jgi:VIT1/CCC1 family predicted Fe2+/Mn2+ transporter